MNPRRYETVNRFQKACLSLLLIVALVPSAWGGIIDHPADEQPEPTPTPTETISPVPESSDTTSTQSADTLTDIIKAFLSTLL
jgi:hypothetical protein